ncbi:MAG: hypothetical protein ACOC8N_04575 [Spirochaetota bacterium]
MKKLILILILLILAAGAGAYFGWVNVPPGSFGVAHSNLTGTVAYPLESGRFHWFWQKLLPANFRVYLVSREPREAAARAEQELPGARELRQYGTFTVEARVSLRYALDYQAARHLIEQDLFEGFHDRLTGAMESRVRDTLSSFVTENLVRSARAGEEVGYDQIDRLQRRLEDAARETARAYRLQNTEVGVSFPRLPRLEVYNRAVGAYFDHIEDLARQERERLQQEAEKQARIGEVEMEMERWERYGRLLARYPHLLKYFYIQKLSEQARVVVVPEDRYTGFPRLLEPEYPSRQPPGEAAPEQAPREPPAEQEPSGEAAPAGPPAPEERAEEARPAPEEPTGEEGRWYESLMFWRYF